MGPTILSYSMSVGSPAGAYQFGRVMCSNVLCSIVYPMKMVSGVHSRPEHSFWYAGAYFGRAYRRHNTRPREAPVTKTLLQGPGKLRSPRHCYKAQGRSGHQDTVTSPQGYINYFLLPVKHPFKHLA